MLVYPKEMKYMEHLNMNWFGVYLAIALVNYIIYTDRMFMNWQ
jgi:hypothetical protein